MSALAMEPDLEVRVRADVYAFLARSTQYPKGSVDYGVLEHVRFEDEALDAARADVVANAGIDIESLKAAHRVLFPAVESQDAPSYQTAYSKRDVFRQGQVMADVAGFYLAHGLAVGGPTKDRPDGIGPELEFLGFLSAKQAHAAANGLSDMAELCEETQQSFLRDHIGAWGPEYGNRVAAVSEHPFYQAFGRLLTLWLDDEMERLEVTPIGIDDAAGSDQAASSELEIKWENIECGGVM